MKTSKYNIWNQTKRNLKLKLKKNLDELKKSQDQMVILRKEKLEEDKKKI